MEDKEKMFWKVVDDISWGTYNTDYMENRRILNKEHSLQFIHSMKMFAIQKRKELKIIMDDFAIKETGKSTNYWGVSDDGFWDLTAHIVGLGEKMYYFILENPIYAKSIKYSENFEYSFNFNEHKKIFEVPTQSDVAEDKKV